MKFLRGGMASGWDTEETKALLGIWGTADVQSQLDGVKRNISIYSKVLREWLNLVMLGGDSSAEPR